MHRVILTGLCESYVLGVVAELELLKPLFPGKSEVEELEMICKSLGTPSEESWSGVKALPEYPTLLANMNKYSNTLSTSFRCKLTEPMLHFLERILVPDPNKRFSSKSCVESSYFATQPLPEIRHVDTINRPSG